MGVEEDVVAWRRHLHRNPEVSFAEHDTAAFVAETLEGFGGALTVERPTETSVLARLSTGRPGPTVALRADIDALPIHEESGVEFALRAPGRDARVRARRAHRDAARCRTDADAEQRAARR